MNIEELPAALDHWDEIKGFIWQDIPTDDFEAIVTGMEAARLVANPNIEAIAEALARYAGYDGVGPGPDYWFGMAKAAVAALTPGDTE